MVVAVAGLHARALKDLPAETIVQTCETVSNTEVRAARAMRAQAMVDIRHAPRIAESGSPNVYASAAEMDAFRQALTTEVAALRGSR